MLKVSGLHFALDEEAACRGGAEVGQGPLVSAVAKALAVDADKIAFARVLRRSIDARKKSDIHFVCSAAVELVAPEGEKELLARGATAYAEYAPLEIPVIEAPKLPAGPAVGEIGDGGNVCLSRPVVVGTGPAGLFAALYMARAGLRPIVIERGGSVEDRAADVAQFMETGMLNMQSNIQFGEGGAGTFSDGKLTTNTNNAFTEHVLYWFVDAGAPQEILWDAKPHIGSDRLPAVVAAIREEIKALGGDVLFNTRLVGLRFSDGKLSEIEITGTGVGSLLPEADAGPLSPEAEAGSVARNSAGSTLQSLWIPCTQLVLACGHSARDTFELLHQHGVYLEQKPFSVGVRIEHPQTLINQAQWGPQAAYGALGAADYKLAAHDCAGRSVYTFCMCPGGEVVCAASEDGGIATNGMSPFARDGDFANAAVLVNVGPEDFKAHTQKSDVANEKDPLAGVRFQQDIEARAYAASIAAGGAPYQVPAQTVWSFMNEADSVRGQHTKRGEEVLANSEESPTSFEESLPNSCARGTVPCNLHEILPAFVCDALVEALPQFESKLHGFAGNEALLLAPETRSSSPVRIARNNELQAWLEARPREEGCGIYPAGEGAGYAGGIMSAACDGLRVASALVKSALEA